MAEVAIAHSPSCLMLESRNSRIRDTLTLIVHGVPVNNSRTKNLKLISCKLHARFSQNGDTSCKQSFVRRCVSRILEKSRSWRAPLDAPATYKWTNLKAVRINPATKHAAHQFWHYLPVILDVRETDPACVHLARAQSDTIHLSHYVRSSPVIRLPTCLRLSSSTLRLSSSPLFLSSSCRLLSCSSHLCRSASCSTLSLSACSSASRSASCAATFACSAAALASRSSRKGFRCAA